MRRFKTSVLAASLVGPLALAGCAGSSSIGEGPVTLTAPQQRAYDAYLKTLGPGAFAISTDGGAGYSYCPSMDTCRGMAVSMALASCGRSAETRCYIYDLGGRVVWRGQPQGGPFIDAMNDQLRTRQGRSALAVDCLARAKAGLSAETRAELARAMQVKLSRVPWTMCDRAVAAGAKGALSEADLARIMTGRDPDAALKERLLAVVGASSTG